mmetsp:Transcript_54436/g.117826  ORF Transcript_54436/g.117826 Transcript_54436/m.117826 type:complete len:207 (+) Transcript_54436:457-1077(+)
MSHRSQLAEHDLELLAIQVVVLVHVVKRPQLNECRLWWLFSVSNGSHCIGPDFLDLLFACRRWEEDIVLTAVRDHTNRLASWREAHFFAEVVAPNFHAEGSDKVFLGLVLARREVNTIGPALGLPQAKNSESEEAVSAAESNLVADRSIQCGLHFGARNRAKVKPCYRFYDSRGRSCVVEYAFVPEVQQPAVNVQVIPLGNRNSPQ